MWESGKMELYVFVVGGGLVDRMDGLYCWNVVLDCVVLLSFLFVFCILYVYFFV